MCGIFAYFCRTGQCVCKESIVQNALKIQHRGPDETHIIHGKLDTDQIIDNYHLVFHRLMINGLSPESGQPLVYPPTAPTSFLMCNGEIYNYHELIDEYNLGSVYHSSSDCEIILHLYHKIGIKATLGKLKGVFAFVLLDTKNQCIVMARDPFGVRSMYYSADHQGYGVCSELKGLYGLAKPSSIQQFPAGCYAQLDTLNMDRYAPQTKLKIHKYYDVNELTVAMGNPSVHSTCLELRKLLFDSVKRRMLCDRKTSNGIPAVGCYLSGGFDSATVAAILSDSYPGQLETFSIGFKGSPDLINAQVVAKYLGSKHHEYVITEEFALENLEKVTKHIESYDVTTNRAGLFMYLLSQKIKEISDVVVVLSGEGSDEASGSYMYFHNAPDDESFEKETLRLLKDLPYFDLLRGDKCSSAAGLEIRTPFLDIDFIEFYKTVPISMKLHNGIEKWVLREAMTSKYGINSQGRQMLPDSIIWRTKEAMSDGVSLHARSWSTIIQEHLMKTQSARSMYVDSGLCDCDSVNDPVLPSEVERKWFKQVFSSEYPGCEGTIPYDWLPKWCGDVCDASARVLSVYNDKIRTGVDLQL
jgi:asparagine synthase (glutamine-hydrolysing)